MKKFFLALSFCGLCLAADVASPSAATKLDKAITVFDAAAISAALGQIEQAGQKVALLPRLQKLQEAYVRKIRLPMAIAVGAGAVSPAAILLGETIVDTTFLHDWVTRRISNSKFVAAAVVLSCICGPVAVCSVYKAWVRRMQVRTIAPIVRILFATKALTFGDDGAKIGAILKGLGIKA